jgi:F-type H+-transporting ATPase subunit a
MSESERTRRPIPKWVKIVVPLGLLALMIGLVLIPGGQKSEFDVAAEFELEPIVKLPTIGMFDLSITKAVIYLWLTVFTIAVIALFVRRGLKRVPGRAQYALESLYDIAREGITGSVMRVGAKTWFPYIASLFFFILITNLWGLVPLPFGEHHTWVFYAATGSLYVTIPLALCTFVATHYAGIKAAGVKGYSKHWVIPGAPPVMKQFVYVMDILSEIFRLVSLSVRLFANMLAGHAILAVFFAMALIFQNYLLGGILQAGSVVFYLFELFVACIQAFIFAILSAVYIGGAMEQH